MKGPALLLFVVGCHAPAPGASREAGVRDVPPPPVSDAAVALPTARPDDDSLARAMTLGTRGDCSIDAGSSSAKAIVLDPWLAEHGITPAPDRVCWERHEGATSVATLCSCAQELRLDDGAVLLGCERTHAEPAYGWRLTTVLYLVESAKLRRVLEVPSGMPSSNFELRVPRISFAPRVDGTTLRFAEVVCRACPTALEVLSGMREDGKALAAYRDVCAVGNDSWTWTGHSFTKVRSPAPISTR